MDNFYSPLSQTMYLGKMTTVGHALLMQIISNVNWWTGRSSGGEGQKDLDASCSLFRLRMIRCKDCTQLWRVSRDREREEWEEGKVNPRVDAPQTQQLITGHFPHWALSLCWHQPVWGLMGVTSACVLSVRIKQSLYHQMLQCLMTLLSILEHWLNIKSV